MIALASSYAERKQYDEMVTHVMKMVKKIYSEPGHEITFEERTLMNLAFTMVISIRRDSREKLHSIEHDDKLRGAREHLDNIGDCRIKIEAEIGQICEDILAFINDWLIPNAKSADNTVFYYKMKGDFCSYLAEVASEERTRTVVANADEAYMEATNIAGSTLARTSLLRLALALNFSIFHIRVLKSHVGYVLARDAITELHASNNNTLWIMQQLKQIVEEGYQEEAYIAKISKAIYNCTPVYVYRYGHGSKLVMRRCNDGWINASHILRFAGFDKHKRASYLGKTVCMNEHEKIQGGNKDYQGTWVPPDQGEKIARDIGVYEKLCDILTREGVELFTGAKPGE